MEEDLLLKPNLATKEGGGQGLGSLGLLAPLRRSASGGVIPLSLFSIIRRSDKNSRAGGMTTNRGRVTTIEALVDALVAGEGAVDGPPGTL